MIHEPHTAILDCRLEVSIVNKTGEMSGKIVNPKILEEHGLRPNFILSVNGYNMEDCLEKLKKKIGEFNE